MIKSVPLYISRSTISTEVNKTGSWRFVKPVFQSKTAPCSANCPAGQDIAFIEILTSQENYQKAWEKILNENPMPSVSGRICFHTCEDACNRAMFDEAVAINSIERFLGDIALEKGFSSSLEIKVNNGKTIAIIGSGPSGLASAYFLTILGYNCEIFEAKSEPGGLLRWGIPEYRLPKEILDKEIQRIKNLGVKIHCNIPVTMDFFKDAKEKYHGLIIGCGHAKSLKMDILGEENAQDGLELLYKIRQNKISSINGTSLVIGGGNAAIDVARSLIRLNSKPILLYRRRIEDMPAFSHEIKLAQKEGVEIRELVMPIGIEKNNSDLILKLQKMKEIEYIKAQHVFTAIGAKAENIWDVFIKDSNAVRFSNSIFIEDKIPVILTGDLANPIKNFANAILSAKQASISLDSFLNKGKDAILKDLENCRVGNGNSISFETYLKGAVKDKSDQIVSFKEINIDYFEQSKRITCSYKKEACRCFNCGICNECDNCFIFCPEVAVTKHKNKRYINLDYCKGCGICNIECPRNAITLTEDKL